MMTALGDPTRQAILDRLSDGPRAVGDLASELPVSEAFMCAGMSSGPSRVWVQYRAPSGTA